MTIFLLILPEISNRAGEGTVLQPTGCFTEETFGLSVLRATSGLAEQLRETIIGPSVLRATSSLAEQLRETTIFGILVRAWYVQPAV